MKKKPCIFWLMLNVQVVLSDLLNKVYLKEMVYSIEERLEITAMARIFNEKHPERNVSHQHVKKTVE